MNSTPRQEQKSLTDHCLLMYLLDHWTNVQSSVHQSTPECSRKLFFCGGFLLPGRSTVSQAGQLLTPPSGEGLTAVCSGVYGTAAVTWPWDDQTLECGQLMHREENEMNMMKGKQT